MSDRFLTTMATRVEFESGVVLMPGDRVIVTAQYEGAYGIEWNDHEGTHAAAVCSEYVYTPTFSPA